MEVLLESKEHEIIKADLTAMQYAEIIKTMTDLDFEEEFGKPIPLPLVSTRELKRIITYCEYHVHGKEEKLKEIDPIDCPIRSNNIYDIVPEWYANFISGMPREEVFELVKAANYLNVNTLIELCTVYIATDIIHKTPSEIREIFGITDDFTEEEKALFAKEHQWVKDAL